MSGSVIDYDAPPTVSRFMRSDKFIRLILGPVGSGKTTGCIFELMRRAAQQHPGQDGIRRTRFAIVRTTLAQMKTTVLKDAQTWLGRIATWKVSESLLVIQVADIYSEWYFIPLDEPEDQKRLLSMQLTAVFVNEFVELDPELLGPMAGRVGRYPGAADGGASWFGIIGDSNMPNEGSEWHKKLTEDLPDDWEVFFQPGGLDPTAENLNWLTQTPETLKLPLGDPKRIAQGRSYYTRLASSQGAAWVKRYVHAQFGTDPDGTAVFNGSFSRSFHVVKGTRLNNPAPEGDEVPLYEGGIEVHRGYPLIVGQDFARNPCSVITQLDPRGRFNALEEIVVEDIGLETHILKNLRPRLMQPRYMGLPVIVIGDPSGVAKGPFGEENAFDILRRHGFACFQASTNLIEPRIRAVEKLMLAAVAGDAMFRVDEGRCSNLIRALGGLYRYGKTKDGETKPKPEKKHPWSDIADALQYAALGADVGMQSIVTKVLDKHYNFTPPPVRGPAFTSAAWT